MNTFKFHDCADLPSTSTLTADEDCLDQVRTAFPAVEWLGAGQYGFALKASAYIGESPRLEQLVIKCGAVSENELRVACELNALLQETPLFPHTYGWLICRDMPADWLQILRVNDRKHLLIKNRPTELLFTFLQPVSTPFERAPLILGHGYRVTLFFLLHGLYVAYERLGFSHNDLHEGNIMMQANLDLRHRDNNVTPLSYPGWQVEITATFVPRLIDYGRSFTRQHSNTPYKTNDLRQLRKIFDARLEDEGDDFDSPAYGEKLAFTRFLVDSKWSELEERYGNDGNADILLSIMMNSYFDVEEICLHQTKRLAIESQISQRCFHCCAPKSNYRVDHKQAAPKYFCGTSCYAAMHGVCHFIK